MTHIKPLGDRLLVRLDEPETVFGNGLIIPDNAREKSNTGVIEAVGTGTHPDANTHLTVEKKAGYDFAVGDKVLLMSAYVGAESGEPGVILVDVAEVLAVLA